METHQKTTKEETVTFEQVEPHFHKWANFFCCLFRGRFEIWELINSTWAYGKVRFLPQSKIGFASKRIRMDMLDYIRNETKYRRQQNRLRRGKKLPKVIPFSVLEKYLTGHRCSFADTRYPSASNAEDSKKKDLVQYLINHPSLSPREQLIMHLIYVDGYNQREAAEQCGFSASLICQMQKSILERFKVLDFAKIV